MNYQFLTVAIVALTSAWCIHCQTTPIIQKIDQICLGCICEAASGCNTTLKCVGDVCGPFHITWGYWADGGKPTLNGELNTSPTAYATCANDPFCAAKAVEGYMEKFAQDCNADGVIDCEDYARIHYLGGYGCTGPLRMHYEIGYNNCRKAFFRSK